jgi:hypothetical protein
LLEDAPAPDVLFGVLVAADVAAAAVAIAGGDVLTSARAVLLVGPGRRRPRSEPDESGQAAQRD